MGCDRLWWWLFRTARRLEGRVHSSLSARHQSPSSSRSSASSTSLTFSNTPLLSSPSSRVALWLHQHACPRRAPSDFFSCCPNAATADSEQRPPSSAFNAHEPSTVCQRCRWSACSGWCDAEVRGSFLDLDHRDPEWTAKASKLKPRFGRLHLGEDSRRR